jgi:hypothetical protein
MQLDFNFCDKTIFTFPLSLYTLQSTDRSSSAALQYASTGTVWLGIAAGQREDHIVIEMH